MAVVPGYRLDPELPRRPLRRLALIDEEGVVLFVAAKESKKILLEP